MSEYILNVDDEGAAHQIIDKFGIEETKVYGYSFTGEEIVRCRDCIYYKPDPDPGWPMMCERTGDDMVERYGFCAWAERRYA